MQMLMQMQMQFWGKPNDVGNLFQCIRKQPVRNESNKKRQL